MTSRTKESSARKWFIGLVLPFLIGLLGLGSIVAMGKTKPKQVAPEGNDVLSRLGRLPIVLAESVQAFEPSRSLDIEVTGIVVPFRQVTLASEVAGRILYKSDACRIGRYVEEGEVLFRLDATDYQLEVDRLAAMRDAEYAQQEELDQEVANAQRSLELAEQDVALQENELQRLEKLPSGFASATELDQARRLRLNASTQRLTIQNQLETLESRRTRVVLGERLVATQLAQAKVNLARTEIRAPISGVIVSEMVEQASYLQKGATLCVIHDTQQVEVSCNLRTDQLMYILDQRDETMIGLPATGSSSESYELPRTPVTVTYRVVGRDETVLQWEGVLSRYEGIGVNSQSRTVPVRITVEAPRKMTRNGKPIGDDGRGAPPALVQGMFVDCAIHTAPKRELVLLPKLALRPGNQVWRFVPDPSILDETAPNPEESASASVSSPDEWMPGRVEIIHNVRAIRTAAGSSTSSRDEAWIVEATDQLRPPSLLIVSPIANLIGDGSDKVRRKISHPHFDTAVLSTEDVP